MSPPRERRGRETSFRKNEPPPPPLRTTFHDDEVRPTRWRDGDIEKNKFRNANLGARTVGLRCSPFLLFFDPPSIPLRGRASSGLALLAFWPSIIRSTPSPSFWFSGFCLSATMNGRGLKEYMTEEGEKKLSPRRLAQCVNHNERAHFMVFPSPLQQQEFLLRHTPKKRIMNGAIRAHPF